MHRKDISPCIKYKPQNCSFHALPSSIVSLHSLQYLYHMFRYVHIHILCISCVHNKFSHISSVYTNPSPHHNLNYIWTYISNISPKSKSNPPSSSSSPPPIILVVLIVVATIRVDGIDGAKALAVAAKRIVAITSFILLGEDDSGLI